MTSQDDRFRQRMNDFRPRKIGRVDVPDIGWPPEGNPGASPKAARHRVFVERTREMCQRSGLNLNQP